MNTRSLNPRLHGLLDYAAAVALMVVPYVVGIPDISPLALGLSLTTGSTLATYSLMTDYRYGLYRILSYRAHIILDLLLAMVLVLIPPVFGFSGLLTSYFWIMAGGMVLVVAVSVPRCGIFVKKGAPAGRFSELRS